MWYLLLLISVPSVFTLRENRTVAIFELLNDVFSSSLGTDETKGNAVTTLEGICIDADLANKPTLNAPYDFAYALSYSTQNPQKFTEAVDGSAPCWTLLLVRTARTLLFNSDALQNSDYEDLDDIIAEVKPLHYQMREDSDKWEIASRIVKTLAASMPRDHTTTKILHRCREITLKEQDENKFILVLIDLVNIMFGYNVDRNKYVEAL